MIKGLYTGAAGMMTQLARQDTISNNLANVTTVGYKKDTAVSSSFPDMLISRLGESTVKPSGKLVQLPPQVIGGLGTGAVIDRVYTNHDQGNLVETSSPLDLAITTDGFFAVETDQGIRYTRDGRLNLNADGMLVNFNGQPILDLSDAPIFLPQGELAISDNGEVYIDDEYQTTLKVVRFNQLDQLQKEGSVQYNSTEEPEVIMYPGIKQGWQESSNVNAIQEMVTLISVMRAYESCQKVIQAEDEMTQTAITNASTMG